MLGVWTTDLSFLRVPGFNRQILKEIFELNKWMALAALGLLGARIDIIMLTQLAGPAEAGYYSAALQLCLIVTMVSTTFLTVLLPKTSQIVEPAEIRRYFRRCLPPLPFGFVGAAGMISVSGWLIPAALGPHFVAAVPPFGFLVASAVLTLVSNPAMLVVFPLRVTALYGLMTLAQLGLRVGANLYLIPVYGAVGAAVVDFIVKVLTVGVSLIVLWAIIRRRAGSSKVEWAT